MSSILQIGNMKLPKSTAIFNLPSGMSCPGQTDLCKKICYAKKAERMYPQTLPYRLRMYELSLRKDFVSIMREEIKRVTQANKKVKITTIRVHESGDFYSQAYVNKWLEISMEFTGIKFYAYTKSFFLDFSKRPSNFVIKLSLDPTSDSSALGTVGDFDGVTWISNTGKDIEEFKTCGGSCNTCSICWETKLNVEFKKH